MTATAFVKPDDNYFGVQLRLISIHGDCHLKKKFLTLGKQLRS